MKYVVLHITITKEFHRAQIRSIYILIEVVMKGLPKMKDDIGTLKILMALYYLKLP